MSSLSVQDFICGLKSGDKKVILEIHKNSFPGVKKFILNNQGASSDCEEIFQEALYQLTIKLQGSHIEINSTFQAYFFTICKNLWRKELNSKRKWVRNDDVIALTRAEDTIEASYEKEQRWILFEQKVKQLSENCRNLLKEYFNKVPYDEIVKKFNYSSENVAFQRMFKCKKKLKELIKKDPKFKNLS